MGRNYTLSYPLWYSTCIYTLFYLADFGLSGLPRRAVSIWLIKLCYLPLLKSRHFHGSSWLMLRVIFFLRFFRTNSPAILFIWLLTQYQRPLIIDEQANWHPPAKILIAFYWYWLSFPRYSFLQHAHYSTCYIYDRWYLVVSDCQHAYQAAAESQFVVGVHVILRTLRAIRFKNHYTSVTCAEKLFIFRASLSPEPSFKFYRSHATFWPICISRTYPLCLILE